MSPAQYTSQEIKNLQDQCVMHKKIILHKLENEDGSDGLMGKLKIAQMRSIYQDWKVELLC